MAIVAQASISFAQKMGSAENGVRSCNPACLSILLRVIASYLPAPNPDAGEIDPAQIPDTLPGYLIGLTAEFTQEEAVIHSAEAGNMGGELYETLGLWSPAFG